MNAKPKPKTGIEQARLRDLDHHERAIRAGMRKFIEIGRHLGIIRRDELFKDVGFAGFGEYVEERFDFSRQHAYRLIDAARVALMVSPTGDKITSEYAARELVPLTADPDKLRAVFEEAERRAEGERVTASLIRDVREELYPGVDTIEGELVDEPPALPAGDPLTQIPAAAAAVEDFHKTAADETNASSAGDTGDGDDELALGNPLSGQNTPAGHPSMSDTSGGQAPAVAAGGRPAPTLPPGPDPSPPPADGRPAHDHPGGNSGDEVPAPPPSAGTAATPPGSGQPGEAPEAGAAVPASGDRTTAPTGGGDEGPTRAGVSGSAPPPELAGIAALTAVIGAIGDLEDHKPADVAELLGDEADDLIEEAASALDAYARWVNGLASAAGGN